MKKLNGFINGQQSGVIVGKIVNWLMAIAGAIFCIYGIYLQAGQASTE